MVKSHMSALFVILNSNNDYEGIFDIYEVSHTREKPYTCSHCGNSFIQNIQSVELEKTHIREALYLFALNSLV